jgi:hypothetical protein
MSNLLNPYKQIMESNFQLLTIWLFAGLAFITNNNVVTVVALLASISTLIRNFPYVRAAAAQAWQKIKTRKK